MNSKLILAAVVVLLIAGGAYAVAHRAQAPAVYVPGTASITTPPLSDNHSWTFEEAELSYDRIPATRVFIDGKFVGSYNGSCHTIEGTNWQLLPGESSGVICWYAGGGDEIGVFGHEVRAGVLDEGSAEVPGTRGGFKTLFTL